MVLYVDYDAAYLVADKRPKVALSDIITVVIQHHPTQNQIHLRMDRFIMNVNCSGTLYY